MSDTKTPVCGTLCSVGTSRDTRPEGHVCMSMLFADDSQTHICCGDAKGPIELLLSELDWRGKSIRDVVGATFWTNIHHSLDSMEGILFTALLASQEKVRTLEAHVEELRLAAALAAGLAQSADAGDILPLDTRPPITVTFRRRAHSEIESQIPEMVDSAMESLRLVDAESAKKAER